MSCSLVRSFVGTRPSQQAAGDSPKLHPNPIRLEDMLDNADRTMRDALLAATRMEVAKLDGALTSRWP